jgi:hypothetical protein
MIPAIMPWSIESCPSEAPTVRSSMIRSGAGQRTGAQDEGEVARLLHVGRPSSICPRAPIRERTTGALTTSSSRTIAIRSFPMFWPVTARSPKDPPPARESWNCTIAPG